MPAAPNPTAPTSRPDTVPPTNTSRILSLVRALIDYGRQLAATLQQRRPATDLLVIARPFGTLDIARIIACIARGLLRAAALEARLATRRDPQPAALSAASPRAPRPAAPAATATDPSDARLPTLEEIAAEDRRRPIGAIIADICRDLGIVARHPLWPEIALVILTNGGCTNGRYLNIVDRLGVRILNPPTPEQLILPPPVPPSALAPTTGPH